MSISTTERFKRDFDRAIECCEAAFPNAASGHDIATVLEVVKIVHLMEIGDRLERVSDELGLFPP
jgi:hypothetical protein